MANEIRTRTNFAGGLVEDAPLLVGATTLTSAGLASLPVIDATNHAAIILDPDGVEGAPEIVWVTAHTAAATSATILRAQEGTTARQHRQDTPWVHTATAYDYAPYTWQTYTPTWTSDNTPQPVIGDGSLDGEYLWDMDKELLHLSISLQWGSTTTGGVNGWHFTLPTGFTAVGSNWTMAGIVFDSSQPAVYGASVNVAGTTTAMSSADNSDQFLTVSSPIAWANGDYLKLSGTIRVTFS